MPCRHTAHFAVLSLLAASAAFAQTADTSGNGTLKGDYFIREVLISGQNADGTLTAAYSVMGIATFDANGNYKFTGQGTVSSALGKVNPQTSRGTYSVGSNGLLVIHSFVSATDYCYGGVAAIGPSAFVASATEGTDVDMLIAIPAGANVANSNFKGNYTGGYIDFLNADITQTREATLNLNADGSGNLANITVNGTAVNLSAGNPGSQTVSGATYALSGEGTGSVNFGTASNQQYISGSKTLYISADGKLVIGGNPAGFDMLIGIASLSAPATNATSSGLYYLAAIEDVVTPAAKASQLPRHAVDGFYGSTNSNGSGTAISHNRIQSFDFPVYDYTYGAQSSIQADGTFNDGVFYNYALAANGQAFIATGTSGYYTLLVGLGAQQYSGPGVFLNPTGIVNAANFAPITNPIAPGEIVTLYGSGLAPSTISASALPLPTILGGVQVNINGTAAPLIYVTPGQIAFIVPQAISPFFKVPYATIQVINNGGVSNKATVYVANTAPGVFSQGGNGVGSAAAQHGADLSLITSSKPAKIGEVVVLYATGLGSVSPAVPDGAAAPSNPLSSVIDTDVVLFGLTQTPTPAFVGLTPGTAGLYQLNVSVANATPTGNDYVYLSTSDGITSEATLPISANGAALQSVVRLKPMVARPHPLLKGSYPFKTEGLPDRGIPAATR